MAKNNEGSQASSVNEQRLRERVWRAVEMHKELQQRLLRLVEKAYKHSLDCASRGELPHITEGGYVLVRVSVNRGAIRIL